MKDRVVCENYICAGMDCRKGFKNVTMDKCSHCPKYRPRKTGNPKKQSFSAKKDKQKDKETRKMIREY